MPDSKKPKHSSGSSDFTLSELIDLALCSPEVGSVNFNILRICLREIVTKTGIDKQPANVNDVEANQVEKYKDYVDGSGTSTPMPGVLKIGPSATSSHPVSPPNGASPHVAKGTGTDAHAGPSQPGSSREKPERRFPHRNERAGPGTGASGAPNDPELAEKVAKLEKHLEALYQLPTNNEILDRAKSGTNAAMTVNDMWQIIQLNNRIAAAETAIQKMASLIEDLAKNMGKVKSDNKHIKKDTEDLQLRKSDLQVQGQELSDKCEKFADVVNELQQDVDALKKGWKKDRDNIEKVLGTDLGKVPSFMKGKQPRSKSPGRPKGGDGGAPAREPSSEREPDTEPTPSEQFERGTQTFVPAKEKGKPPTGEPRQRQRSKEQEQSGEPRQQQRDQKQSGEPRQKQRDQEQSGEPRQKQRDQEQSGEPRQKQRDQEQSGEPRQKQRDQEQPGEPRQKQRDQEQSGEPRQKQRDPEQSGEPRQQQKDQKQPGEPRQKQRDQEPSGEPRQKQKDQEPSGEPRQKQRDPEQPGEPRQQQKDQKQPGEPRQKQKDQEPSGEPRQKQRDPEQPGEPRQQQKDPKQPGEPRERQKEQTPSSGQQGSPQQQKQPQSQGQQKSKGKPAEDSAETSKSDGPQPTSENEQDEYSTKDEPGRLSQGGGGREKSKSTGQSQDPKQQREGDGSNKDQASTSSPPDDYSDSLPSDDKKPAAGPQQMSQTKGTQGGGPREGIADKPKSKSTGPGQSAEPKQHKGSGQGPMAGGQEPSRRSEGSGPRGQGSVAGEHDEYSDTDEQQQDHEFENEDQSDGVEPWSDGPKRKTSDRPKAKQTRRSSKVPVHAGEDQPKRLTPLEPGDDGALPLEFGEPIPSQSVTEEAEEFNEGLSSPNEDEQQAPEMGSDESGKDEGVGTGPGGARRKSGFKDRPKPMASRHKEKQKHHRHHHPEDGGKHAPVDVVQGPIPRPGEPLPPVTMEDYLASLPPQEAANMAADAVQKELQKQYQHLQGMQRQLATDIQDKMEYIYQKLLKEIATQQMTTSPYMTVGGPEECLGPGICTGHGMPAGIAVCQFPEAKDKKGGGAVPDGKVCPGPGICPGSAVCPYCRADSKAQDALHTLKDPVKRSAGGAGALPSSAAPLTIELDGALLQEMKSLVLLDLEKLRDEMRSKQVGAYDEQDILERLNAVWEALKILKYNEEALAVKIARQDAFFKKIPVKTIEKLHKIPDENLDALVTGNFQKPMYIPDDSRRSTVRDAEEAFRNPMARHSPPAAATGADKEDIQTLFNNLANVIAECTEQKDRVDQLADTARILESGMVTKQMLLDALSDKADKGLINTKVSYDEFGTTIDELHTQLHNLMVEGYQRNENWKKVTADLAEELAEKLDKVELAPIRTFFKSHLKTLEEKVKTLTNLIEEPDSAGTRKKLLRDYNCLSCDRIVNISGVTNGPLLPTIGPIPAGHSTASKRALDLHRMRMMKQLDPNAKNLNALERQAKGIKNRAGKKGTGAADPMEIANDMDVMPVVNRYTGGSHTTITNADLIAAQRRKSSRNAEPQTATSTARLESRQSAAELVEVSSPPPPPPITASLSFEYMNNE